MKLTAWMVVFAFSLGIWGCGDLSQDLETAPSTGNSGEVGETPVIGTGGIGSQCLAEGSFVPPQPVPLKLYQLDAEGNANQCPMGLPVVELAESLPSITLQADCKKRIIDVRGQDRQSSTSWEFMPNGAFDVSINGGFAKFKTDGAGTKNCQSPMVANLVGHVDCTEMDKPKIYLDTYWNLDQVVIAPPSGRPSSLPSSSPSSFPSLSPSPGSSISPTPAPSPSGFPAGGPTPLPQGSGIPVPNLQRKCKLPPNCYFFNEVRIDQCS
jgi:hypothetical protein